MYRSDTINSKNGIPIRLTDERWEHIITEHAELYESRADVLRTVSDPDFVYGGKTEELLAIGEVATGKWMVVVYRELTK